MEIKELLSLTIQNNASDLHLTENEPPMLRINGALKRTALGPLDKEQLKRLIYSFLSDTQKAEFEKELELDISLALPGLDRFRTNVHMQRGSVEAAFRRIPLNIPGFDELMPSSVADILKSLSHKPNGLVLITGPTGSGKSTTLATMVEFINNERELLIYSIEDPIEFLHTNKKSIIKQREVYSDTKSFTNALRHVLRQDPNVIMVGEMRDLETIAIALTAAETGHLVLATLHTPDAPQTIQRIIDVFPADQQRQIKLQLSECLQGVVSQILLPHINGKARVLATEIMLATPAIRNLIREQEVEQIPTIMQTNANIGMHTMDKSLKELYDAGLISLETALEKAKLPDQFRSI